MRFLYCWLTVAMCLLLMGCDGMILDEGKEGMTIVLTKSQQEVLDKGNDFAFQLLRETYNENAGDNLFLSPMGVTIVSSMLANGAAGRTYDEIVETIGLKGYTLDQVNDCYSTLVTALYKADPSVSFSLANSTWVANDLSLKKAFRSNMEKTFDAESFSVDFSASGTLKQVNDWCSKKTNGLIPKMFDQLSPLTRMLLINALYFKGDWVYAFMEANTAEGEFQTLAGPSVRLPFMSLLSDQLEAYQDPSVSLVKMPYGKGAFLMEAIIPAGDLAPFLARLSMEMLQRWDQSAQKTLVQVRFPKFTAEFDTEESLVPVLTRMGMKRAFSAEAADFSNMADEGLYVSNFRQKTYVKVDEKGTEAAAVTEAEMRKNSAGSGLSISFDRPFVYLIREKSTGAILFIGLKIK